MICSQVVSIKQVPHILLTDAADNTKGLFYVLSAGNSTVLFIERLL